MSAIIALQPPPGAPAAARLRRPQPGRGQGRRVVSTVGCLWGQVEGRSPSSSGRSGSSPYVARPARPSNTFGLVTIASSQCSLRPDILTVETQHRCGLALRGLHLTLLVAVYPANRGLAGSGPIQNEEVALLPGRIAPKGRTESPELLQLSRLPAN